HQDYYTPPVAAPTYTPTPAPTAQVDQSQTHSPAAAPRKVFSSPHWAGDRESITVTNKGDNPITVKAWVDSPSNNLSIPIKAGATENISTAPVLTQNNQLLTVGFDAYEAGAPIDAYKATIAIRATPAPTTGTKVSRVPGFTMLIALACVAGMAYLMSRRKDEK
ncbi:MAG TPA: hypothetical protein VMC61_05885, partial [Methanocella sp.]|nr:hypothetical protein [Methanocella sp.]